MPPESSSSHRHQAIFKSIEASHIHCNGIITSHKETKDWTGQHSDRGALQGCRDVSTRRTQPRTPPPLPGCIHPLLTPPTHHRWQVTRTHSDGQDGRAPLRLRRHDSPIHRIKVRHSHTSRGRRQAAVRYHARGKTAGAAAYSQPPPGCCASPSCGSPSCTGRANACPRPCGRCRHPSLPRSDAEYADVDLQSYVTRTKVEGAGTGT